MSVHISDIFAISAISAISMSRLFKRLAAARDCAGASAASGDTDTEESLTQPRAKQPRREEERAVGLTMTPLAGLFATVGLKMLGLIAHYMWAIPMVVANRVGLIATATGADGSSTEKVYLELYLVSFIVGVRVRRLYSLPPHPG